MNRDLEQTQRRGLEDSPKKKNWTNPLVKLITKAKGDDFFILESSDNNFQIKSIDYYDHRRLVDRKLVEAKTIIFYLSPKTPFYCSPEYQR